MKYHLVKIKPEKPYYELYIRADYNDGDYISETTMLSKKQLDEWGLEAYQLILNKLMGPHALDEMEELLTEDEYNLLENIDFPYSDHGICHSMSTIRLKYYDEDGFIYDVVLN